MIKRDDIAHRAHAHATCMCSCADRVQTWRRNPALVGAKMMFDAKSIIETKFIAQLKFAPQLFIALMGRHSGLRPDVGKMGKLHSTVSQAIWSSIVSWQFGHRTNHTSGR